VGMEKPMGRAGCCRGGTGTLSGDAHRVAAWSFPLIPSAEAGIGAIFFLLPGPGCRMQLWEMRIHPVPAPGSSTDLFNRYPCHLKGLFLGFYLQVYDHLLLF